MQLEIYLFKLKMTVYDHNNWAQMCLLYYVIKKIIIPKILVAY